MKKLLMILMAMGLSSNAFAITAQELGKKYFPTWQPSKSVYCDTIQTIYKPNSVASFSINMPIHLIIEQYEITADLAKSSELLFKTYKKFDIEFESISVNKYDSDFVNVDFITPNGSNSDSILLYFDKLEKYKTNMCIRVIP